jgi:DHA1 family tetracycline resistance protein-like MFS transporter
VTDTVEKKPSRQALLIIFVTVFIDLLGFGIVLPLLPRYAESFGADKLDLGMLMASFSAMQFLFAPVWGGLSDKFGRRPILLIGLAGSTLFYAMFAYVTSLGASGTLSGNATVLWLLVSRIGAGIAGATIPTAQAFIADSTDKANRTRGMALIGAAFGVGFTFGPLIGAMFVSDDPSGAPSPNAGYAASILSGVALMWAIFKLPESLQPGETTRSHGFRFSELTRALSTKATATVLLSIFLTTFAFAQFETTLSLLTKALGQSDRNNFYLFAYVGLVLTIAQGGIVRRLAKTMPAIRLAAGGTLIMVIGLLLIGLAGNNSSVLQLYLFVPVAVVGFSAVTPSLQSLLSLNTAADEQGEILGLGQSMSALARILGPVAGMLLFSREHVARPYWAGAGLMVVALLFMLATKSNSQPDVDAPAEATGEE